MGNILKINIRWTICWEFQFLAEELNQIHDTIDYRFLCGEAGVIFVREVE